MFFSYVSATKKITKEGKEKDDSTTGNRIVETRRIHINIYPSNLSINKKNIYYMKLYRRGEFKRQKKKKIKTASFRWRINWPDRLDCGRRSPTFKL